MKKHIAFTLMAMALAASLFAADIFASPAGYGPDWKVVVSIDEQKTYVYKKDALVRQMVCSTGLIDGDNDTPLGDYIINESGQKRGTSFFSKRFNVGARWWVGFIGGVYLFHSVPIDSAGNVIPAEEAKLGKPASHGCVRLSMEDAKWFFDTVPDGAKLHIQKEAAAK
ncbi:MAG: L,D-transpeptidase [Treponema sp.]|nr:L,D-transpeptidase [Treponema sp.]